MTKDINGKPKRISIFRFVFKNTVSQILHILHLNDPIRKFDKESFKDKTWFIQNSNKGPVFISGGENANANANANAGISSF